VEATYRIRLSREELEPISNVGGLLNLIQAKIAARGEETAAAA